MLKKITWKSLLIYTIGTFILTFGLCLNKTTRLGVSAIMTIYATTADILHLELGDATFLIYVLFVFVQIVIHLRLRKREKWTSGQLRTILIMDVLQIAVSVVFTRIMNLYMRILPDFAVDYAGQFLGGYAGKILISLAAIVCIGVGAGLTLDTRIVPNPGDGLVQCIADMTHKETGIIKNCVDLVCVILSVILGQLLLGRIVNIGIGTILSMLLVGRVISIYHILVEIRSRSRGR